MPDLDPDDPNHPYQQMLDRLNDERHLSAQAVADCQLCDDDGYTPALRVCDHIDHRPAAKRGSALCRKALDEAKARRGA